MTRVTLDSVLRDKLLDLSEPIDLCDESGRVVARVVPFFDPDEYEPWEPPVSEDELRRREESQPRYTTADVLRHLRGI